ncbi:MAG: hypothetical protein NT167_28700, partial [Verrucomicrobia bacterium]|nr:hypothetical protein [Verrucomicrobiota bacterium]
AAPVRPGQREGAKPGPAVGPGALATRWDQQREDYMRARQAASVLWRGMALCDRPGVQRSTLRRDTISWRVERDGWSTVLWVTVTEYAPGLIRLRNDVYASIPRDVWAFALPKRQRFELTFHWTEMTTDLGEPLYAFCSALADEGVELGWPLFDEEDAYPGYAWTRKGRALIEAREAEARERRLRVQRGVAG